MGVSNIEDGIFFDVNNSFCRTFGYALEELIGRSSLEINLWVDPRDRAQALEKIKQTGSVHDYETKMYTKNREIKEVVFSSNKIVINGKECLMSWIRDVTDDNKKNEQLQNMQRLESIGVLAGGIAHDFNNLLMGIFGNLQLAELKAGADDPTLVYIKRALDAVNKGASLAGQLLTYSKGGQPKKEIILLQNLVPSWVKFHLSGSSNIKTEFNISNELWPVNADIGQLNQVISNLVINAKQAMLIGGKFTVEGKNIEYARDIPAVLSPGYYILLSFQDQGPGIEPYTLGKIFDPFFSTKQNGHGLGLATAYSIINKHGGYLTVESKLGQGATFKIYLPAEPKAEPFFHAKIEHGSAKLSGRILLMDDEPDILASTKLFLEQCGFEVATASHGEEAISLYKKAMETNQRFDTVILDLTIREGLGGKDALKEIRFFDPQVRAIVASGYSDDPIIHDPHEFGFVGSLIKPYKFEDLRKNLEKLNKPKDDHS
jgi:PAS domain S-box-containing protein